MKRLAIRLPWQRRSNRLGLSRGLRPPVRAERQLLKRAVVGAAGLAGFAIGCAFGPGLLALCAPGLVRVASLEIAGNVHTDPAQLVAASGLGGDFTLADVEPSAVARALEQLPWVRRARAAALLPNRVVVSIEERVPVAVARLADGSRWLVDAAGVAFAPAPAETRGPELLGAESVPPPPAADPSLAAGVALLAQWNAAGLPPARAVEVAGELGAALPAVVLADRELRVVVGGGDPRERLARLARVLALREPALARAVAIDLRFPGQGVVRFAAPCPSEAKSLGGAAAPGKDPGAAASLGGEEQCHAKTT
jgi:cell division septal protein FtsQ